MWKFVLWKNITWRSVLKKTFNRFFCRGLFVVLILMWGSISIIHADVPSFDDNFADYLVDGAPDEYWRNETVFNMCIDRTKTLKENIMILFYPWAWAVSSDCSLWWSGGLIWNLVRIIWFGVLVLFIVWTGINFLLESDNPDKIKEVTKWFMYIAYGSFLFFGATWLLWSNVLNIANLAWTQDLVDKLQWGPDSLFFQILSFLKVLSFFTAIIMLVYYWFKIMSAMDQEDKIKESRKWIVNVLIALVIIKIIDYVYYIAQVPEFTQKASDLVFEVWKVMLYVLWASFVLALFYAWFLLLTWWGDDAQFKKAKNILAWIFLWAIVLFLFLLIIYQILAEFSPV